MVYDPSRHHRRSIRLQDYDYASTGAYFVTICTQGRMCFFGSMENDTMVLNEAGRMVQTVWDELKIFYPGVDTDEFIIMPNHIHGIITLVGAAPRGRPESGQPSEFGQPRGVAPTGQPSELGQPLGVALTLTLADVVHRFKTMTTKRYADGVKQLGWTPFVGRLWQRNYYEHIIRNDKSLNRIRQYIADNPGRWGLDGENPVATASEPEDVWLQ